MLKVLERASPNTPDAGYSVLYVKTDGKWYYKDTSGNEFLLSPLETSAFSPGGRLTLTTGVPVTTSDVTAAATVYYTPCVHDTIQVYNGSGWQGHNFTELSQALSDATKSPAAAAVSSVYDMFVWSDGGTIRCTRGPAWSTVTSRGTGAGTTELEYLGGRLVNKVAITNGPAAQRGLYVGTVATNSGAAQVDDSQAKRNVWNMYNRRRRDMMRKDSTSTWTYSTATWRQARADAANQLEFVRGLDEDNVEALVSIGSQHSVAGQFGMHGIQLDDTTDVHTDCFYGRIDHSNANDVAFHTATWSGFPGIGRHFLAWVERGSGTGTMTWRSQATNSVIGGMRGAVWG